MRKYIAPGAWFFLEYPDTWRECEDTEESFLFYNPDKWTGNFRISAYQGGKNYARECMDDELLRTSGSKLIEVGAWKCVYWSESFHENNMWYTTHFWITGLGSISVECSFTVMKGESPKQGEEIVSSLIVRRPEDKPIKEIIPVRVLEINAINEMFDWAVTTIKKQLNKDFTSVEADIDNIQKVMDSGKFNTGQRQAWESFGFAFGSILENEMDGMDWVTVVDGNKEFPALRFRGTQVIVDPSMLVWGKVRNGKSCNLRAEYDRIKSEVEATF